MWTFCEALILWTSQVFSLALACNFLNLTTFLRQIFRKYIRLIFLPHFTTTTYGLYHSKYGFRQVHFGHLVLNMRHFSNVIIDIHDDLRIRISHYILHNLWIWYILYAGEYEKKFSINFSYPLIYMKLKLYPTPGKYFLSSHLLFIPSHQISTLFQYR